MAKRKETSGQSGGISISGDVASGDVIGGDRVTRGDVITVGEVGAGAAVAAGRGAAASVGESSELVAALAQWQAQMEAKIEKQPDLSTDDKKDLKDQVGKIQAEAAKGEQADVGRLERLVNTLGVMAPDIFEVAVATLANPIAGIGLVFKKVGDKAKLEQKPASP